MSDNIAKVVMIDRSVYDNLNPPENNTIYFVREGSPYTSKALSLYVGEAKQCDLLDITGETTFDPQTNEYSIPQAYRIDGKLLFSQQTIVTEKLNPGDQKTDDNSYSFFRISMWDSASGKFKDCTGFPNNVILVKDGQLPYTGSQGVPGDAIKDFIYVDVMNRNIYVFDGNSYIPLVNLSEYATQEWVLDQIGQVHFDVNVDNVTILKDTINNVPNTLHGAGADVSGKTFTDTSTTPSVTMTAYTGAHIFNNYQNNIATRPYSSVFGFDNKEKIDPNVTLQNYANGSNIIGGYSNTVFGVDRSFIFGAYNTANYTGTTSGTSISTCIVGRNNSLSGTKNYGNSDEIPHINIFGKYNSTTLNIPGSNLNTSFICGYQNTATLNDKKPTTLIGFQNSATTDSSSGGANYATCMIGDENGLTNTSGYTIIGYYNHVRNIGTEESSEGCSIIGHTNTVQSKTSQAVNLMGSQLEIYGTATSDANMISMIGTSNSINIGDSKEASKCYIVGRSNSIQATDSSVNTCVLVGHGLYSKWSDCVVLGKSNTRTLPTLPSGSTATLIIGNGANNNYKNIAIATSDNEMFYYGDVTDAGTDMSLKASFRTVTVTPSSGAVTLANLPRNGDETILNPSTSGAEISSITISDLSVPIMGTATDIGLDVANGEVDDYCATIAFKPNGTISSASNILTNFNPTGQEPRIYLMNPDIDVSTYTVIHLLLFYDGFNVCCTVAGYEEVPSV